VYPLIVLDSSSLIKLKINIVFAKKTTLLASLEHNCFVGLYCEVTVSQLSAVKRYDSSTSWI